MRLFGLEITKAAPQALAPLGSRNWWPIVRDPYPGAWQHNDELTLDTTLAYHAVYACVTLISADIGKLRLRLVEQEDGIWTETESAAFSPVLRKPNRYQNHIQWKEWHITSKLIRGNAYQLKQRDNRGVVISLYPLDPSRVVPLVAPDGSIFYQLGDDNLSGLNENSVQVPASEIIHDRMNCLFHPLVGVSPLYAAGLAANHGLRMQRDSSTFFENGSNPGGVLTAPGAISDATAARLKEAWNTNFTGSNAGKVAVLGDGLTFEAMRMSSTDAQLIEQLRWTAEVVCSVFHVPAYMIGVGNAPTYNNVEALAQQYYSQCLQSLIESLELCLDEGLGLDTPKDGSRLGTELDLDGLLRMDTKTQVDTMAAGVGSAIFTPNEARKKFDLAPKIGGDTPYLQQQNYSLEALDARDRNDPFAKPEPAPALPPPDNAPPDEPPPDEPPEDQAAAFADALNKCFALALKD